MLSEYNRFHRHDLSTSKEPVIFIEIKEKSWFMDSGI